jgi:DNA-directed RNA polymerase subunit beta
VVARDSGVTVVAKHDGVVESVDAGRIVVAPKDAAERRRQRSRHLQPGEVPALEPEHLPQPEAHREEGRQGEEGRRHRRRPFDETGELALGQNVVVAFMPWGVTTSKTRS